MMELKPCPFCGGEMQFRAALWPSEGDTEGIIHKDTAGGECGISEFNMGMTDESTIEAWNRRATDENAAYERAAMVCEEIDEQSEVGDALVMCAAAIRRLKK